MITQAELDEIKKRLPPRNAAISWHNLTVWRLITELETLHARTFAYAPVRGSDPDTSRDAAAKVAPKMTANRLHVLKVFEQVKSCTDEELGAYYMAMMLPVQSGSGLRSRRAELVVDGYLMDSGMRRKNKHGNNCVVWVRTLKAAPEAAQ